MFLLVLFSLFAVWMFYNFHWKRRGLPPGPAPLPIVGNMLSLKKLGVDKALTKYRNEYGDLHTLWFGENPVVTINDVPTILETVMKDGDTYAGRPTHFNVTQEQRGGFFGLIFVDGPLWRDQRRFALQVLRNFGLNRALMEERVLDEVVTMLDGIRAQQRQETEVNVQDLIDIAVGSIINVLLFGYRFTGGREKEFYKIKVLLQDLIRGIGKPLNRMADHNPLLFRLFPSLSREVRQLMQQIEGFFHQQISEHRAHIDLDTEEEPNDYVEAFLRHRHKLELEGVQDHTFTDQQLFAACVDLWLAGQETTSNTLAWMVIYLMLHPSAQGRMREELHRHVGAGRLVTLSHKPDLHYTNAVIAETQRLCNLIPLNVNHRLLKDTTIHGYHIPAGTTIIPQVSNVLYDPRYFPEPMQFRPERFLDKQNKFFQPPALMPFGVGKRACLGESLARLELYLFGSNLFNCFNLKVAPHRKPDTTRIIGGTVQPEPFVCIASE